MLDSHEPAAWLDLVLELRPVAMPRGASSGDAVAQMQSAFEAIVKPVRRAVRALGGRVKDEAWINSTLKCRVPASGLDALSAQQEIIAIDLPRELTREH